MKAKQIQEQLEKLHYWDARVLSLDSQYFGDEVTIIDASKRSRPSVNSELLQ